MRPAARYTHLSYSILFDVMRPEWGGGGGVGEGVVESNPQPRSQPTAGQIPVEDDASGGKRQRTCLAEEAMAVVTAITPPLHAHFTVAAVKWSR